MVSARHIFVRGVVQGVGFRPLVYRLALEHRLTGWVLNAEEGVEIWLEGTEAGLGRFLDDLETKPPPAAVVVEVEIEEATPRGFRDFTIRHSRTAARPTVRISPDLPVCDTCLQEMRDPNDRRYRYGYITCTDCGPRYSIVTSLPYDRPRTTMKGWPLCARCSAEYDDPLDRRFHAQPVACPACGPSFVLRRANSPAAGGWEAVVGAAALLQAGDIVAVKGLGGYHLACDAANPATVAALRERKFRKEKAFAVMVADVATASEIAQLSAADMHLLVSAARPIVVVPKRCSLEEVAPDNSYVGMMLPYTPLHHLLFDAGAPKVLVMTSANRSSEPIAYRDEEALAALSGIADAFLLGERPIARRIDDSVVKSTSGAPTMLRRGRGYAPSAVARIDSANPILAVGGDLKNSISLVVDGQAFVSQHIGDLEHYGAYRAFEETIDDLTRMYDLRLEDTVVAHDAHPGYRSTGHALDLSAAHHVAVQHHRAHIASVLAEKGAWETSILGIACDGTGYGDDGAVWGGEFLAGSLAAGLERVGHLRYARLPGGDAAARHPVQAAAGFLAEMDLPDLTAPPFGFPDRYVKALELAAKGVLALPTSSVGRLFDTVAALLGFTREMSFEGQAAMWLEHLAASSAANDAYPFSFRDGELDYREALSNVVADRRGGRAVSDIARNFHVGLAGGLAEGIVALQSDHAFEAVVVSGGVFQNGLLLSSLQRLVADMGIALWLPSSVPMNDGGISLGQAAFAARSATSSPVSRA